MKLAILLFSFVCILNFACHSQTKEPALNPMAIAAKNFLQSLTTEQKAKAQFSFDDPERYHWNYVPMARKGIVLKELNTTQRNAAMSLMHTALSEEGFQKTRSIMELETILKVLENRPPDDDRRDPEKYYFSIFGNPAADAVWGWRLEGHHVSFNFSSDTKKIVSGTPGFLGSNPAVVLSGPEKGKEILKDEAALGFALLHSMDNPQKQKTIINTIAPADIVTDSSRKVMLTKTEGILYSELNAAQQKILMRLLLVYIHRYKEPYAAELRHEIDSAGINNLRFAWAGAQQPGVGNPHYYRIQGPTILIEYDNTQNNANHAHTVVRDLQHDFGGDELLEHYRNKKH
jgi:hypothetical protein